MVSFISLQNDATAAEYLEILLYFAYFQNFTIEI